MVSQQQIRQLALALPEAIEEDHHGRRSFRVAGRIFATLWDETHINVMLDEPGIRTAVQSKPVVCEEFWWGKKLRAVHVDLSSAKEALARELLADAWEQKAPKRLLRNRTDAPRGAVNLRVSARCLKTQRDFGLGDDDLRAWQESGLSDDAFDDWLTDRVARRPAGARARETYGADDARTPPSPGIAQARGDRDLTAGADESEQSPAFSGSLLDRQAMHQSLVAIRSLLPRNGCQCLTGWRSRCRLTGWIRSIAGVSSERHGPLLLLVRAGVIGVAAAFSPEQRSASRWRHCSFPAPASVAP